MAAASQHIPLISLIWSDAPLFPWSDQTCLYFPTWVKYASISLVSGSKTWLQRLVWGQGSSLHTGQGGRLCSLTLGICPVHIASGFLLGP